MHDISPDVLRDLYQVKRYTARQISDELEVGFRTVLRRLHQFGINVRPAGPKHHVRLKSREWLYRQYVTLEKPSTQIAREIGASSGSVYRWIRKHGIPTRPAGGSLKGKKMSNEGRRKMSVARRGRYKAADNPNWKGGYVEPTYAERRCYKAKLWREAVKKRDGHKCVKCGAENVKLHTHHIKPWRTHPEGRFDVSNGMTLCVPCHEAEHGFDFKVYDKVKRTRAQSTRNE